MEDGALQAFLDSQQSQGRYFDSADFTINTLKAREKLARYQLSDSGLWLVKMIQAAVAGGADSVKVTFGRSEVSVAFPNTPGWQADQVLQEVLAGTMPSDNALAHLVTGIRASAGATTEVVSWACGQAQVTLSEDGGEVTQIPETASFALTATRPTRSRSLKSTLGASVAHLVKQTVEEYDAVVTRCWTSPIPICVDGRPLSRGYSLLSGGERAKGVLTGYQRFNHQNGRISGCLAIRPLDNVTSRPLMPYHPPQGEPVEGTDVAVSKPFYYGGYYLNWRPQQTECRGVLCLLCGAAARSSVELVMDGVVIKSIPFSGWAPPPPKFLGMTSPAVHFPIQFRLILGVERQELDLSEFDLRELDLQATLDSAIPEVVELIECLRHNKRSFWYVPFSEKYVKLMGGLAAGQLVYMLGVVKFGLLPVAGLVGASVGLNTAVYKSQYNTLVKGALKHLEEQLNQSHKEGP